MKIVIEIPEKTYQKIIAGTYDYGDMNVIIQNGTQYEERPHGEWIVRRNKQMAHIYSVCSKCNVPYLDTDFPNFCPNCGAEMRRARI